MGQIFLTGLIVLGVFLVILTVVSSYDEWSQQDEPHEKERD